MVMLFYLFFRGCAVRVNKSYIIMCIAFLFAFLYSMIPWEEFREVPFWDRDVYISSFMAGGGRLSEVSLNGIFDYVTNEWAWHYIIQDLMSRGASIEVIFACITFASIYIFSYYLITQNGVFSLFFLINPLVVDFVFSQLRLACAISMLMVYFLVKEKSRLGWLLVAVAPFIHTGSLIFIVIYLACYFVVKFGHQRHIWRFYTVIALMLLGFMLAIFLGPLKDSLLVALNDRRVGAYDSVSSTLLYSSYWIMLLLLVLVRFKDFILRIDTAVAVLVLGLVSMNAVVGGYSTRFLAATFPFLISLMYTMRGYWKVASLGFFAIYTAAQWYYWMG